MDARFRNSIYQCELDCHYNNFLNLQREIGTHWARATAKDYVIVRGWVKRRWRNKVKCCAGRCVDTTGNGEERVRVLNYANWYSMGVAID